MNSISIQVGIVGVRQTFLSNGRAELVSITGPLECRQQNVEKCLESKEEPSPGHQCISPRQDNPCTCRHRHIAWGPTPTSTSRPFQSYLPNGPSFAWAIACIIAIRINVSLEWSTSVTRPDSAAAHTQHEYRQPKAILLLPTPFAGKKTGIGTGDAE